MRTRDVTSSSNAVKLNGETIGHLTPTGLGNAGTDAFSIDPDDLDTVDLNNLTIESSQPEDFYVSEISLGTGPVPTQPKLPDTGATTYWLTFLGVLAWASGFTLLIKRAVK